MINTHHIYLIFHLLAATIWVGGHLVLALGFLPKALKNKDFSYIDKFEKTYEPIGMPSLLVLLITGILMAYVKPLLRGILNGRVSCWPRSIACAISWDWRLHPTLRARLTAGWLMWLRGCWPCGPAPRPIRILRCVTRSVLCSPNQESRLRTAATARLGKSSSR